MIGHPVKALLLIAPMLLAACATGDMADYPSLATRPVERQANVPPAPPVVPVPEPVSATLEQALVALARDADAGDGAFQTALAEARSLASGLGAAAGSEQWAIAQRALSRADAARGPTLLALAELDRILIEQADRGGAVDAVAAVQARVAALVAGQERALAGLGDDSL